METPSDPPGFRPESAFAEAAGRFFELLKAFGLPSAAQPGDWSRLAAPLAGQYEQWLRMSQAGGPWGAALAATMPAFGAAAPGAAMPGFGTWAMPGFGGPAAGGFGAPPLGPAAAQSGDGQRAFELMGRLAQLQGQLAGHWSEIANSAAQRFVARLGSAAGPPATVDQALKVYELWVSCAEEAYAATVHKEDYARLQSELANTSAALLVEQRRHAEAVARAFGLPTRSELDALRRELQELRSSLGARRAPAGAGARTAAGARGGARPRNPPPKPRRAPSGRASRARGGRGSRR
jgi:Poly(R)-hydroxyalkanoic acid synthase subunit (PHA_synth_III_E)